MVAVWLLAIAPAVAVKIAAVFPAVTVTDAGTVNAAVLLESVTVAPPAGAGALSEAVHVDPPPVMRLAGAQLSAPRAGSGGDAGTTTPPTPFVTSRFPPGSAPNAFATLIAALATPDAIVTLTTATTPFCITVVFMPANRQM